MQRLSQRTQRLRSFTSAEGSLYIITCNLTNINFSVLGLGNSPFDGGNQALNAKLVVPGVTTSFCMPWGQGTYSAGNTPLCQRYMATQFNTAYALQAFQVTQAQFIVVDEIRKDSTCAEPCDQIVKNVLATNPAYAGRILFFFSVSSIPDAWNKYSTLLATCATGACRIAFETCVCLYCSLFLISSVSSPESSCPLFVML
jgi:hypothetical protein